MMLHANLHTMESPYVLILIKKTYIEENTKYLALFHSDEKYEGIF